MQQTSMHSEQTLAERQCNAIILCLINGNILYFATGRNGPSNHKAAIRRTVNTQQRVIRMFTANVPHLGALMFPLSVYRTYLLHQIRYSGSFNKYRG